MRTRKASTIEDHLSILICDDHEVLRHLLRARLENWFDGAEILEAADGEAAITIAAERNPDVIIMDIALPGMNGIDATKAIKRWSPDTPVVILSVHELDAYRDEARNAGALHYIAKRNMHSELSAVLSELLDGRTASAESSKD